MKPTKALNFIFGPNNAGKTSILESIHLASTSKSFKASDLDKLANYQANCYKVAIKFSENTSNDVIIFEKHLNKPKRLYLNEKLTSGCSAHNAIPYCTISS